MACFLRHGCDEVALNIDTGEAYARYDDGTGKPLSQHATRAYANDPTQTMHFSTTKTPLIMPFTDANGNPSLTDVNGTFAVNPMTGQSYTLNDYKTTTLAPSLYVSTNQNGAAGLCVRDVDFTTYAMAHWAADHEGLDVEY
jgi:hypothetical protein